MELSLENEADLIKKAGSDPNAFLILYEHYLPQMYRYSYYRTKSKQEAEDVVSQTFLNAMENITKFKQKGVPFGCWLYRIAANVIYHGHRKTARENSYQDRVHSTEIDITPEQIDLLMFLHELPQVQQQVLTLRYIQDLSIRDVALALNRSEGAVKQLALRGLRTLRERMGDHER